MSLYVNGLKLKNKDDMFRLSNDLNCHFNDIFISEYEKQKKELLFVFLFLINERKRDPFSFIQLNDIVFFLETRCRTPFNLYKKNKITKTQKTLKKLKESTDKTESVHPSLINRILIEYLSQ